MYATFRETGSIGPMVVHQVAGGTFEGLKATMMAALNNPQYKVPRVVRDALCLDLLIANIIVS